MREYRHSDGSSWRTVNLATSTAQQWTESSDAKGTIMTMYHRVKSNCMGLVPLDGEYLGISLDVLGATHSCDPDAIRRFKGARLST